MGPDTSLQMNMHSPADSHSSKTPALLLFSRPECHLCEVAAGLLESSNLSWQVRNIDEDVELLRRYRIRIPVLYRPDIKAELFWPFGAEQLQQFLELKE
jgi:hypothetical protein